MKTVNVIQVFPSIVAFDYQLGRPLKYRSDSVRHMGTISVPDGFDTDELETIWGQFRKECVERQQEEVERNPGRALLLPVPNFVDWLVERYPEIEPGRKTESMFLEIDF